MQRFSRAVLMLALSGLLTSCADLRKSLDAFNSSFDSLRTNKLLITAHVQTDQIEHPSEIMKLPIGGQEIKFHKIPEFSQRSISGFEPFKTDDFEKDGYGAVLLLDTKGRNALDLATRTYRGMVILTMVNAVPIDMIEIDQPITDGRFTIWRGLPQKTIDEMDKFYPRIKYMNPKSSSRFVPDMLPSTSKEKINSHRDAKAVEAAEKAAELDRANGVVRKPRKVAPRNDIIPLEGFKLPGT